MKVLNVPTVLIVLLVLVAATAAAQDVGPKRGSLVAVGGGSRLGEAGIWRRFIDLAGGNEATIVVIRRPARKRPTISSGPACAGYATRARST